MVCIILKVSKIFHVNFNYDEMERASIWLFFCNVLLLMSKTVLVFFRDTISPANFYCWTNIDKSWTNLLDQLRLQKLLDLATLIHRHALP